METSNECIRLVTQARSLIAENKADVAKVCLDLALRLDPAFPDARMLLSEFSLSAGDVPGALAHLDTALAREPANVPLLRQRARCHTQMGEKARAIMDLSEAFIHAPKDFDLLIDLGEALAGADLHGEAATFYKQAVDLCIEQNDVTRALNAQYRVGLCMDLVGNADAALEVFEAIVSIQPTFPGARGNVAKLLWRAQRREEASVIAKEEIETGTDDQNYYVMYVTWLMNNNRKDEARSLLSDASVKFPDNMVFQHLAAAIRGDKVSAAPNDYIEQVFDAYAANFDDHLIKGLTYRGPGVIARHVEHNLPASGRFQACLDLGCGTGLMGFVLREWVDRLVGVDLSAKMLESAQDKGLYDRLEKADIKQFVKDELAAGRHYDLVTAADVFLYLGDLSGICADIQSIMPDESFFIFSVELSDEEDGYKLLPNGRFAYSKAYLETCLREGGFTHFSVVQDQLRMEGKAPVEHLIAVARKGAAPVMK